MLKYICIFNVKTWDRLTVCRLLYRIISRLTTEDVRFRLSYCISKLYKRGFQRQSSQKSGTRELEDIFGMKSNRDRMMQASMHLEFSLSAANNANDYLITITRVLG